VKQSESNPLRRELAQGKQGEPHPDSDVLTAFSESALMQVERQKVLAHLSGCADCREVLSIAATAALDSMDDIEPFHQTSSPVAPRRRWLSWASVIAGLLVVCSVLLVYQQKMALPKNTAVATRKTAQAPSSTFHQPAPSPSPDRNEAHSGTAERPASKPLQTPQLSQNLIAENAIPQNQSELAKRSGVNLQNASQARVQADEMATQGIPAPQATTFPSTLAFANTAPARAMANASLAAVARPHWRINGLGQPERSFGDGAWQAVLPHEQSRMRVVSVFDSEVWIGGDSSRLYHSTDNGTTWNLIALPGKDGREHSIAHIHFQTTQSGTVESDDGTVWTTSNGGSTWN
jgi:hypothetical protein